MTLIKKTQQHIKALVPADAELTVALSGGMDSVTLLNCLSESGYKLSACHVNHGCAPTAPAWEKFCKNECARLKIPLTVFHVKASPASSEKALREKRYAAFARLPPTNLILAHHANDQAETVLFRLFRGTGVPGLQGMTATGALYNNPLISIIRPWLKVPKEDIEQHARAQRLHWIEDTDNRNHARRRNYLRQVILPATESHFPAPIASISNIAAKCQTTATLLTELACEDEAQARTPTGNLSLAYFQAKGSARFKNWLHYRLSAAYVKINEKMIDEIAKQILVSKKAPVRNIDCGAIKIMVTGDTFELTMQRAQERTAEN